ncbi:MAG: tRNA (guanine(10)-N(2))-dimethyltransferase [Candidatus Micrarchaeota archaeon]|nr:tRNA (guanine(10)-N(2))-dimethyltransferase [Candidatus Micrarchaeota archaeon]
MQSVSEGTAAIRIGKGVFYNPKMSKLRDISVIFLIAMALRNARLLDATTATGVRGIRYSLEAGVKDTTMIDMNAAAAANARANVRLNKIRAKVIGKSLQELAAHSHDAFDIIDLDPFGSPAPLIYDALRVSKDGTALMVTATDTATLSGAEGPACLRIYGARPMHNHLCHESGVRILLGFMARQAAQFNFGIEPLLSIADMHYIRVFLVLRRGAENATASMKELGLVAHCSKCQNFSFKKGSTAQLDTVCKYCGNQMQVYGPMWLGKLKDEEIVGKMSEISDSYPRDAGNLIRSLYEELDLPFFYAIRKLTSYIGVGSVPMSPVIGLLGKKHAVSRTHFDKDAIKTDATTEEVIRAVKKTASSARRR